MGLPGGTEYTPDSARIDEYSKGSPSATGILTYNTERIMPFSSGRGAQQKQPKLVVPDFPIYVKLLHGISAPVLLDLSLSIRLNSDFRYKLQRAIVV